MPEAEPRPAGTPLPPELLGEIIEGAEGTPKYTNTYFDAGQKIGLWLPPGVERIRGVHLNLIASPLHGGGMINTPLDRQLASSWQFASIAGWYVWQPDRSSAEAGWAAVQQLLDKVAAETNHPELATAPVIVSGGSRTGNWGPLMLELIPDRMIGYVTLVADAVGEKHRSPLLLSTPGLLVPGSSDKGPQIISGMEGLRSQGARVAGAMMWNVGHKCGPCEHIIFPFIDAVVQHRLGGGTQVQDAGENSVWFGDHQSWSAYPAGEYPGDPKVASWLIDPHFANIWRSFTLQAPKGQFTQPQLLARSPSVSTTRAADLTSVSVKLEGVTGSVQLYDGATRLGDGVPDDQGNVTFTGLVMKPGIHSFLIMQGATPLTRPVLGQLL